MNTADVTGAVRRLRRRVVLPALPRVQAGFKTIYRQCQPQNLARNLPKIPRFHWTRQSPAALPPIPVPTATALRGAGAASVVAAATSSGARPVAPAPATLDEVLEEIDRADAAAEFSLPEPTPSTWFDEYDSSPTPLQPARPKEPPNPR